jgi:hypothetical protein
MGSHPETGVIRLTLPAQADFVSVLRVAVRVVSTRAGCDDDTRSRLQATAGSTFFVMLDGTATEAAIEVVFTLGQGSVALDMTRGVPIAADKLRELDSLDGPPELRDERRTVSIRSTG